MDSSGGQSSTGCKYSQVTWNLIRKMSRKLDQLACSVPAKGHGATLRPGGDPQGEKADQDAAKVGQKVRSVRHDGQTVSSVSTWRIHEMPSETNEEVRKSVQGFTSLDLRHVHDVICPLHRRELPIKKKQTESNPMAFGTTWEYGQEDLAGGVATFPTISYQDDGRVSE